MEAPIFEIIFIHFNTWQTISDESLWKHNRKYIFKKEAIAVTSFFPVVDFYFRFNIH